MKIPLPPPDFNQLSLGLQGLEPTKIAQIFSVKPTDHKDRYLHWNQVQYKVRSDGLTAEQYWLGTKIARRALLKEVPLFDKEHREFRFATPDIVQRLLHEVDRNASGHISMAEQVTDTLSRDTYLVRSLVEEAITSSQLEGASTSRKVAKEMLLSERQPRNRSEQMILNNYYGMQFVRDIKQEKLTPEIICELHRIVSQDSLDDSEDAGRPRTTDDVRVFDMTQSRILHIPPKADELQERMRNLCNFANQASTEAFVHPVIRAILLHFMLAYDHPFVDGNGRTARALFYWSMANQGYWLTEYISVSRIIRRAPAKYGYAYLYSETDDNDVTYFLIHQLEVIQRALNDLHVYLSKKMQDYQEAVRFLAQTPLVNRLNHRQVALLEHALKHPGAVYQIKEHQNLHKITYQTARTDLLTMSDDLDLFLKVKRGNSFIFIATADLKQRVSAK